MKILLAGGTGFIGSALLKRLADEKESVILLTRRPEAAQALSMPSVEVEEWDGKTTGTWARRVEEVDGVMNLSGESIGAKRWTAVRKDLILRSRLESTRAIVSAISLARKKPKVLINASAVGYYGAVERGEVDESFPRGRDFLADTCGQWENEALRAEAFGVRVVLIRTGIVLDKNAGALKKFLLPFRLFVGGPLGSGRQWFPWIHLDDVVGAILFALRSGALSGPVNLAAPQPVTMREFCSALAKVLRRPSWAPVPPLILRIVLGEMAGMVLTGQCVVPRKLQEAGYNFRYPRLDEALASILRKGKL
jgi:uncharacterized protein (TIGR01777 family)